MYGLFHYLGTIHKYVFYYFMNSLIHSRYWRKTPPIACLNLCCSWFVCFLISPEAVLFEFACAGCMSQVLVGYAALLEQME